MQTSKKIKAIKSFIISAIVMIFFCFSFKPSYGQGPAGHDKGLSIIAGEHGKYFLLKVDTVYYRVYVSGKLMYTVVRDSKDKFTPTHTRPLCSFVSVDSSGKLEEVYLPCKE